METWTRQHENKLITPAARLSTPSTIVFGSACCGGMPNPDCDPNPDGAFPPPSGANAPPEGIPNCDESNGLLLDMGGRQDE